jgi:hypothetical protein
MTNKTVKANKGIWQSCRIQNQYTKVSAFLYTSKEQSKREVSSQHYNNKGMKEGKQGGKGGGGVKRKKKVILKC